MLSHIEQDAQSFLEDYSQDSGRIHTLLSVFPGSLGASS